MTLLFMHVLSTRFGTRIHFWIGQEEACYVFMSNTINSLSKMQMFSFFVVEKTKGDNHQHKQCFLICYYWVMFFPWTFPWVTCFVKKSWCPTLSSEHQTQNCSSSSFWLMKEVFRKASPVSILASKSSNNDMTTEEDTDCCYWSWTTTRPLHLIKNGLSTTALLTFYLDGYGSNLIWKCHFCHKMATLSQSIEGAWKVIEAQDASISIGSWGV